MKGITPVISVILLLLVAIAIVGFASGFFQRVLGTASSGAEEQLETGVGQLSQSIRIESAGLEKVIIRNIGSQDVDTAKLVIFANDISRASVLCTPPEISPQEITECAIEPACVAGETVKVSGPSNSDTAVC